MTIEKPELKYHIPKNWLIFLYVYYFILVIIGVIFILDILWYKMKPDITPILIKKYTFIVSMLSSAMMAGVCYSRKLYKACIDGNLQYQNDNSAVIIGNIVYFFLRPIYAVVFTVVFVICIIAGFLFIMNGVDFVINERMVYFAAVTSSFIGYSVGNVLDMFELHSSEKIKKIF